MAKRPIFNAPLLPSGTAFRGQVMAFAPEADAMLRIGEAMSRLSLDQDQLADLLGFNPDAIQSSRIATSGPVQQRLSEVLVIIDAVKTWAGGDQAALERYRTVSIPASGDTAETMVKAGYARAVDRYIDGIAVGGFA